MMTPVPPHRLGLPADGTSGCTRNLRLLADDLTGALDAAAQFSRVCGMVSTFWRREDLAELPTSAAFDCGTREMNSTESEVVFEDAAAVLESRSDRLSFLKLDSLFRGNFAAELHCCLRHEPERRVIVAPAFPYQGRVTREAQQFVREGDHWLPIGPNIREQLGERGLVSQNARPGMRLPRGISIWDSAIDDDLRRIAAEGLAADEPVLWCGSAGLAGALAQELGGRSDEQLQTFDAPLFGFFGSDHPVMREQLDVCARFVRRIANAEAVSCGKPGEGTEERIFFVPDVAAGLSRAEARRQIECIFRALVKKLPQPGTIVVSGGETLHELCEALGATCLEVMKQYEPGVPCSRLSGGIWPNTVVISKSGAFGDREFLSRLIARLPRAEICH